MPRFLLAAGSNGSAQLGLGHRDDVSAFSTCRFATSATNHVSQYNIVDLASGANHSLLLLLPDQSCRREVWVTGTNEYRQLGPQFSMQTTLNQWTPLDVDLLLCEAGINLSDAKLERIEYEPIAIGCSWTTSFIVFSRSRDGKRLPDFILAFGTNDFGELACGTTSKDEGSAVTQVSIVRLPGWQDVLSTSSLHKQGFLVEHLAVGQRHMACVCRSSVRGDSSKQKVYGWGAARHGQLAAHSYTDGRAAGSSSAGHLSSSSPAPCVRDTSKSPRRPAKAPASKIPQAKYPTTQTIPIPIDLFESIAPDLPAQITGISCGATHTVLLLSNGRILGLGSNAKGQLDLTLDERRSHVSAVSCTWNGTVSCAASSDGRNVEIWTTGSNTHGQLGRSTETETDSQRVPLPDSSRPPSRIRKLICGSEHVLLLTSRSSEEDSHSTLYGWGWNEHGNLALGMAVDQWTPAEIPVAVPGREGHVELVNVWAGCGTSWVLVECE